MIIEETYLRGCYVIEPKIFEDERGYFFESFNKKEFEEKIGKKINFVQDNQSFSKRGVIRALHMQKGEYTQAKLVRVIKGKILDIVVDVRKNSETFGKHFSIELSGKNKKQLFIPRGFLHGFSCLEDNTIVTYKCDNYYNKQAEVGVRYDDKSLGIDWGTFEEEILLSHKDRNLLNFSAFIKVIDKLKNS